MNANDYMPDINNVNESDIVGVWMVVSISRTDDNEVHHLGMDERKFHYFLGNNTYRFEVQSKYSEGTWGLNTIEQGGQKKFNITTNLGGEYLIFDIKKDEMILLQGNLEYLLSRES